MLYKFILFLILLNCLYSIPAVKRSFHFNLYSIVCKTIGAPVKQFDCNINKLNARSYVLNGYVELYRDLARNAEIQFQLHFRTPKGIKVVKLLDFRVNLCDLLDHSNAVPLIQQLLNEVFRTGNLPYACPFKGNYLYNLTNFNLTDDYVPKYMPSIFFNMSVAYYENKKVFATILLQGSKL